MRKLKIFNQRLNARLFYLLLIGITFASCSVEESLINRKNFKRVNVITKRLRGNEAKRAVALLNEKNHGRKITDINTINASSRANNFTINFEDIIEVIDSLGIKNFTFKVLNHPEDNYKTFHNLVITERDEELRATMMKYEMTEEFAQEYNSGVKSFYEFMGKVSSSAFPITFLIDPCDEMEVEVPSHISGGDNSGGGLGGGTDTGDPPASDPGGGIAGGINSCATVSLSFGCSCGRSFDSWEGAYNCASSAAGYTITIVISYSYSFCRMENNNPCNPNGSIGVINPPNEVDCNTSKDDLKLVFPNTPDSTLEEIANNINLYAADFGIDTKEELQHFLAQAGHESTNYAGIRFGTFTENLNYKIANLGVSAFERLFNPASNPTANPNKANPNDYINPSNPTYANKELLANYVYDDANRLEGYKLGNVNVGDGYKYIGRGIIQLTGKENYTNFNTFYQENYDNSVNLVTNPELVASDKKIAVISALWFFKNNVMDEIPNGITENTPVKKITKLINGKYKGLSDRATLFQNAQNNINCL